MSVTDPTSAGSSPAGMSGTSSGASGASGSTPIASTALRALALAVVSTAGATAVKSFRAAVTGVLAPLVTYVVHIAVGDSQRFKGVTAARWALVDNVADLLDKYPNLHPTLTGDDLRAGKSEAANMALGAQDMRVIMKELDDTALLLRVQVWAACSVVLATGHVLAKGDKNLATDLTPIKAALKVGPRTDTAPKTAAADAVRVTKAEQKLAKAQAKAASSSAAAAKVDAAHGTGGAIITTPAPSGTGTPPRS